MNLKILSVSMCVFMLGTNKFAIAGDYCNASRKEILVYKTLTGTINLGKVLFYGNMLPFVIVHRIVEARKGNKNILLYIAKKEWPWLTANIAMFFLGGHISHYESRENVEEEWERIEEKMSLGDEVVIILTENDPKKLQAEFSIIEEKMMQLKKKYPFGSYKIIHGSDPAQWVAEAVQFANQHGPIDELAFDGHGSTYLDFFYAINSPSQLHAVSQMMDDDSHLYLGGCTDAVGSQDLKNLERVYRTLFQNRKGGSISASRSTTAGLAAQYTAAEMAVDRAFSPGWHFIEILINQLSWQYKLSDSFHEGNCNSLELLKEGASFVYPTPDR